MTEPNRRRTARARMGWALVVTMVLSLAWKGESVSADDIAVGKPAPEFSLIGSDGRTYSLKDYRGKKAVVLAWFPKAFTGG